MLQTALIRIAYTGIMFLAGLILSNLALPEKFGTISLLILNASLLTIVTGFGMDSMVLYKVSNKQWSISEAYQFIWRGIFMQIGIFLLLELGSLFFFKRTLLSQGGTDYFAVDAYYFVGLLIVDKYLSLFYALHKSRLVNLILAIIAFFYLLVLILFYYFIQIDFEYILYVFAFQSLLQGIALIICFRHGHDSKAAFEHKKFFGALKISAIVMLTNVVQLFAYRVDFWLLKYFYSNYEVGIYAQANKFANLSWIIPNIMAQLLLPKYADMDDDRRKEVFSAAFYFNLIILLATVLCTQLFYFYYLDPEYKAGLAAFYLMLPGYFFWGSVIYFGSFISAKGKFSYNLICSSLCFILIACADLILIPLYGTEGAAVANSICYTAIFFVYLYIIVTKFSISWSGFLWPRKKGWSSVIKLVISE